MMKTGLKSLLSPSGSLRRCGASAEMPTWELLLWLASVGLHLGVCALAVVHGTHWLDDSHVYWRLATNLHEAGRYSQEATPPFLPDTLRLPGYPILIMLFGFRVWLLVVVQHLLVFLGAGCVWQLGRTFYSDKGARRLALFWLMQPYPALFASLLLTEVWFICLVLLFLWMLARHCDTQRTIHLAIGLLAITGAVFLKGLAVPVAIIGVIGLLVRQRGRLRNLLPRLALASLVPAGLLLGWCWRNWQVSGHFGLATQSHVAFWYGRVGGMEALRQGQAFEETTLVRLADSIGRAGLPDSDSLYTHRFGRFGNFDYAVLNPKAVRIGWQYVQANAWLAVRFHALALWQMLQGIGHGTALKITRKPWLAYCLAGLQFLGNLGMYAGLALFGMALLRTPRFAPVWVWVWAFCAASMLLLHMAAWADGRYRMVADPLFVLLGGWGIAQLAANDTKRP